MHSYQEMIRLVIAGIVVLFYLKETSGECPNMDDIPVMYDKEHFTCAWAYSGAGSAYDVDACNDCYGSTGFHYTYHDQTESDSGICCYWPIGSLIIRPGCQIYLYSDVGYHGDVTTYGPGIHPNLHGPVDELTGNNCYGWKGYKCRCQMTPPVCDPIDSYHTVFQCDNSANQHHEATCRYKKVIGTQYTNSWSESMSIDVSIEASMKATIYGIFETGISTSVTTGYNWGKAGSEVFNEEQEFEITVTVEPGFIMKFDQAVGECGGNNVKTELFKITEIDASRNAINRVWYERTLNNGTTISLDKLPLPSQINIQSIYLELEDTLDEQIDKVVPE